MRDRLLFDSAVWLVWAAPFLGILAAGFTRRRDPHIAGERVLRHDDAAILEHWTHGLGTAVLLLSGIVLGLRFGFARSFVSGPSSAAFWMNVHFAAVIVFLFGTFYYAANTLLSWHRFREHLPTRNAFQFTKQHYGKLLGFKFDMPAEDKYFESEKVAYLLALAATSGVIISGFVKVAAHMVDIPGSVMGPVSLLHDVSTVAMLAFFMAHVFFAAIAPFSWPVLGSMFTGYVSLEQAQHEHAGWYARLRGEHAQSEPDERNAA
jgi:formate dehydrogenase subunit gamma